MNMTRTEYQLPAGPPESAYAKTGGGNDIADFTMSTVSPDIMNYPKRKFVGFAPNVSTADQMAIRQELGIGMPTPRQMPKTPYVSGPVIYDSEGRIAGRTYDMEDPFVVQREIFNKLNTEQRVTLATELQRLGWYGSSKPSQALVSGVGWEQTDEQVFARLLNLSNNSQRQWTDIVGLLGNFPSTASAGVTVRVTSDEDAAAYTREVFLQQLGRMPTRREMAEAANFIRSRERQAAAAGQQLPNTGLVAEAFAQQADPTSRTVYGLGNAISLAFQALGR